MPARPNFIKVWTRILSEWPRLKEAFIAFDDLEFVEELEEIAHKIEKRGYAHRFRVPPQAPVSAPTQPSTPVQVPTSQARSPELTSMEEALKDKGIT